MNFSTTALLLIGYQNDYFSPDGILHGVIEESLHANDVLSNTINLLDQLKGESLLIISTPICFTANYEELENPVGILKAVKEAGAFKVGTEGAETIGELKQFGDSIVEVPGKRGLDAFSNTELNEILQNHGVEDVVIAGVVTSVCVDTTGRSAHEQGYRVAVLSDCTAGRTSYEQHFYCENIFPIYSEVIDSWELLARLSGKSAERSNG